MPNDILTRQIHRGRARRRWFACFLVNYRVGIICVLVEGYTPEGSTDLITLIEVRLLISSINGRGTYALSGLEMDL
jgi:hypothetical protein